MSQADKIIKDSTKYTVSTIIAQVIGIFTSIAIRRFLTPEMMGIWAILLVVLNYLLFAHLGIFTAVGVKIPYLRGKNKDNEIQIMRNTAFTFGIIISFVMMAVLFIVSFVFAHRMPYYVILGIRMIALIITTTLFYNLYIVMLRADKNFSLLSKAVVFNSVAMFLFIAILAYFFRLKGVYFATFFATLASWLYIRFRTRYNLKLTFKLHQALALSKIGLPILIGGIAYTILISIDKIMIIRMIGAKELGFYSIAILALTYTNTFPKLFGIVIFPNMQEAFGRTDSKEHILGYVKQPALIMAYIFPALLAAAYFAIPVLVYYVLPKYILGINSMKILLCGCFFISLVPLAQNFVISINKQVVLIPITAAAVIFGIGMNYSMIKMGYGIGGVAFGISVAYLVYFIAMFCYALIHCEKWPKIYEFFIRIFIPFLYSVVIVLALEYFVKVGSVINKALVQAPIFYLAYLPMIWYINKKTMIISMVFKRKAKAFLAAEEELFANTWG